MPITVADVAQARGAVNLSEDSFEAVGLPYACSCIVCNKVIPPQAAFPSQAGKLKCQDHVGATGFDSVERFEKYMAVFSLHKQAGGR